MGSPFNLILLRHGQSVYNQEQRFTGWTDVPLTPAGEAEARQAGLLLRAGGLEFDIAFTSLLKRAIRTQEIVCEEMGLEWVPRVKAWELNERHYGSLQGRTKDEVAAEEGADQVRLWRRGFSQRPPPLDYDDPRHPRFDGRYRFLPPERLPSAESLADVSDRIVPFWEETIGPQIRSGRRAIVVSHGNSLRALIKYLDGISDEDIFGVEIPTGVPVVYELDGDLRPVSRRLLSGGGPERV